MGVAQLLLTGSLGAGGFKYMPTALYCCKHVGKYVSMQVGKRMLQSYLQLPFSLQAGADNFCSSMRVLLCHE